MTQWSSGKNNEGGRFDPEIIAALIKAGETEAVELKLEEVFQSDLAEILMSMANTGGEAWLVVGVEDRPIRVRGVENIKDVVDRIYNAARQVVPSLAHIIEIEQVRVEAKTVIVVQIPGGLPGVYHVNGRYLRRRGSQRLPIHAEELLRLLHLRGGGYYEDQPVPGATLADIDPTRVDWSIERRENRRSSHLPSTPPLSEFLDKQGLLSAGFPTVAALLFFGRDPQRFFPYHVIRAMRFSDNTTAEPRDREDISGTVPEMIERTLGFIERNTRHPARFEGALRVDDDEYPMVAVREAVANACAHRDMAVTNGQLRVFVFSDRLLVDSPGELLPGVRIERLTQISRLRNPRLAQLLYDTAYMERAGTGISRMIAAMVGRGLEPPVFEEVANSLQVTLRGPEYGRVATAQPAQGLKPLVSPEVRAELNGRQLRFLSMLRERGQMSRRDYETAFEVSERTANNDLLALVRKGLVRTVGSSVRTVYVLSFES